MVYGEITLPVKRPERVNWMYKKEEAIWDELLQIFDIRFYGNIPDSR